MNIKLLGLFLAFLISSSFRTVTYKSTSSIHANVTETMNDTIIKIESKPHLGFNFPYYIRIPKNVNIDITQFLLVEINNTGNNDTLSFHEKRTYMQVKPNSFGSSICQKLKLPFLVPVFPRPVKDWKIYTHAFDRDVALIKEGEMKRLDLQLIAMIEDAKIQLMKHKIKLHNKILMTGFSASGTFANRFTLIHPEIIAGVACGGINAIPILPIKKIKKYDLNYPLGINDFEKIFGDSVKYNSYRKIPQYLYMGENDKNDAVLFDDGYDKNERKTVFKILGKTMMPIRWNNCKSVYEKEQISATFKTYSGIGHETNKEVFTDVCAFFNTIIESYD